MTNHGKKQSGNEPNTPSPGEKNDATNFTTWHGCLKPSILNELFHPSQIPSLRHGPK